MEPRKDYRKLGLAVIISLFVHLVIGYSLAAFGSAFTPTLPMDEKPVELTIVDLPDTPTSQVPTNPPFMETATSKETKEKPKEQTFESNANSIAASQLPATGDLPLPSQEGKERKSMNLETHDYSLPTKGSEPQPEAETTEVPESKPEAPSKPESPKQSLPTPMPVKEPEPQQFAMLTTTPPPPIKAPDETEPSPSTMIAQSTPARAPRPKPTRASSSYQAQKEQTRISGGVSSRGPSSVNAVGTPLGRYKKAVSDAIGSRWYYYYEKRRDLVGIGTALISADVDAEGHVQNLRVVSNDANETFAGICLQSFQEARIPPIPPVLIETLPDGMLHVDFSFTSYAN